MNLDALIHRKFPPITQQSAAEDTVDFQSSAIVSTARRLDHEVRGAARASLRTSRFVCLKSVKSSPQEKRHH
jgi:ribosomal protein S10